MLLGAVLLQVCARQVAGVFALSDEIQSLCVCAIRIITLGYLFVGANIAYQGIFQALGDGVGSLILSLLRLIVVALPLAWAFTKSARAETLIWTAFPVAEACAFLAALFLMRRLSEKTLAVMR
ncbi:MATE family efflux transporter [Intestinibacillus massiliensis]|nr:MATE family efflux transporter [Intestinibacillus massiliensis]